MDTSKTILNPPTLARPSGYSHGIVTQGGRLLFLAGQPALDAEGRIVAVGDLVAQYARALANLQMVVEAAGGQLTDIVQLTVYVRDVRTYRARRQELRTAWQSFFGHYYPAMALVEVNNLFDDDALVEIQGVAVIPERG